MLPLNVPAHRSKDNTTKRPLFFVSPAACHVQNFSAPYDPYEHADCSYHQKWYDASEYAFMMTLINSTTCAPFIKEYTV